jgi:hypothetical protein
VVDVPLTVAFFGAVLPAFGVLFLAYNGYDRAFRDQTLFLFLMGGGLAGVLLFVLEAFLAVPAARPDGFAFGLAMASVGFALLDALVVAMVANRRASQGQRATIYYAGAFGMGYAATLAMLHAMDDFSLYRMYNVPAAGPFALGAGLLVLLAVALTALHFAAGALVGVGVAERTLRQRLPQAVLVAVPFNALLFLYLRGCGTPGDPSSFVLGGCNQAWLGLGALYALGLGAWAAQRLLPRGLDANQRRERRRLLRKQEA